MRESLKMDETKECFEFRLKTGMFKESTEREISETQKKARDGDQKWSTRLLINQNLQIQVKEAGCFFILFYFFTWKSIHYKTSCMSLTSLTQWPIFPIYLTRIY